MCLCFQPPQTEVQQSEPQELPEPLPAPVFEVVQILNKILRRLFTFHLPFKYKLFICAISF